MNILNSLTIKNLKLNKKRTILTIIGIILSVALICAVSGMVTSFRQTLINYAIIDGGNRHITVENVKKEDLKYFQNNNNVKNMFLTTNLGYAEVDNFNEYKPYAYVIGYTKEAFSNTTINMVDGRLPLNSNEIVISLPYKNGTTYKLNDSITLNIGDRVCEDGTILNQNNPYNNPKDEDDCHEKIINKVSKTYTIVGIMERPNFSLEEYSAPGYTMITYADEVNSNINVSLLFKDPNYYKEYTSNIRRDSVLGAYNISYNTELLRWSGAGLSDRSMQVLFSIAFIVIGIIIFTSVFVIRNSFEISTQEKRKQYGMLSSVGATSKQIKKNVLYEGFILGLIGIPLGILSGIFADFILVLIINYYGNFSFEDIKFAFSISIWPILVSILLGIVTIYLSVIKSARKSSKISPIEAIRNNNEIKINNKKVRSPKIIDKLFGIGGIVAYKNLKRNKKRNRTTVISIVVSVFVFISLSSFISYGFKMTGQYYTDLNYSIQLYVNDKTGDKLNEAYDYIKSLSNVSRYSLNRSINMSFNYEDYYTKDALDYFDTNDGLSATIMAVGNKEFERLLQENDVSESDYFNKGLLIDSNMIYVKEDYYKEINLIDLSKSKTINGKIDDRDLSIDIIKRIKVLPMGLQHVYSGSPWIIVSDDYYNYIINEYNVIKNNSGSIYIDCSDADKIEAKINEYLKSINFTDYNLINMQKVAEMQRSTIILVSIFLYGFITVISLIGVTNIINTINTNMSLRKREFAIFKSIGMTKNEFNQMIALESIMYSTKSLIIGIPLGLGGSYLIYKAFATGSDFGYIIPWSSIIISILVVYVLVSVIMYFGLKSTDSDNIIDAIKEENI